MAHHIPSIQPEPRASAESQRSRQLPENASEKTIDVVMAPDTLLKIEDSPPNGGYGWVCVVCCALINAHTWGINSSYAVFLSYYLNNDYFPNTSPLAYAFIGGLSISMAMLVAPVGTRIIHLYGSKTCLYLGVFFETLSLIGASFATQKYQIVLAQGFCFGWGMGFLFVGSVGIIPQWFTTRRSLANAIGAAGSGAGGLTYSLATQRIIDTMGLPWAFRILGICSFAVNITAASLLRDRNKQTGARHKAFDLKTLRRPEFLLVQAWGWFSMFGYTILLFSLPAYATTIGLNARQGSIIGAVLNAGQMIGRPFIGLSSDRLGRINVATILTIVCGLLCLAFWVPAEVTPHPMGLMCFFAIVGGLGAGTFWTTIGPVAAEVVGLQDLPGALSLTWLGIVLPTTCAEPIALELRRTNADSWVFLPPQIFTLLTYILGGLCLWVVRGWKVGDMEWQAKMQRERDQRPETIWTGEKKTAAGIPARADAGAENPAQPPAHGEAMLGVDGVDEVERRLWKRKEIWAPKNLLRNMMAWKVV